jgi:tRNA U34 5-carboxymethylaminomethyl modifying GTPase MnmE/TrmE/vacuolar-type H+-ATPase subunit H
MMGQGGDMAESSNKSSVENIKTLVQIVKEGGRSFQSVERAKNELRQQRDTLQLLWNDVTSSVTDLEKRELAKSGDKGEASRDALVQILEETRGLLDSSSVDIGIFGHVKRGKSSLVNALVGKEVSATDMLPTTAVPVSVEFDEKESAEISQSDGKTISCTVSKAITATTQDERERRIANKLPLVERVRVRMPLEWLPKGVRIIDTPGLADPKNKDIYEEFVVAELDRVAAAIYVICQPPGVESHDVDIIEGLARHGVTKMFFVANMWQDVWTESERTRLRKYLQGIVKAAQPPESPLHKDDERVITVNLKQANSFDRPAKIKESNISELQTAIETFLSTGILTRISSGAAERLLRVADVIEGRLTQREKTLRHPQRLPELVTELENAVKAKEACLRDVSRETELDIEQLSVQVKRTIESSLSGIRVSLAAMKSREDLRNFETRMPIEIQTLTSRLVTQIQRGVIPIVDAARTKILQSLKFDSWTYTHSGVSAGLFEMRFPEELSVGEFKAGTDFRPEARLAGGILGAIASGGAGLALIATGPIGLAVGGLIGMLFGDVLGKWFSDHGNSREATQAEIGQLTQRVKEYESKIVSGATEELRKVTAELKQALSSIQEAVIRDQRVEIESLTALLEDTEQIDIALKNITDFRRRLGEITGR